MYFLFQTEELKIGRMKKFLSIWGRYCHAQPISLKYEFVSFIVQSSLCAQNVVSSCDEVLGAEPCWTETTLPVLPNLCLNTVSPTSPLLLPSPGSVSPVELLDLSTVAFCRQVVADLQEACNGVWVFGVWVLEGVGTCIRFSELPVSKRYATLLCWNKSCWQCCALCLH